MGRCGSSRAFCLQRPTLRSFKAAKAEPGRRGPLRSIKGRDNWRRQRKVQRSNYSQLTTLHPTHPVVHRSSPSTSPMHRPPRSHLTLPAVHRPSHSPNTNLLAPPPHPPAVQRRPSLPPPFCLKRSHGVRKLCVGHGAQELGHLRKQGRQACCILDPVLHCQDGVSIQVRRRVLQG